MTNKKQLTAKETKKFNEQLATLKKELGNSSQAEYDRQSLKIKDNIIKQRQKNEIFDDSHSQKRLFDDDEESNEKLINYTPLLYFPSVIPVVNNPTIAPLSNWIAKSSIFAPRPQNKTRVDTGSTWIQLESPRGLQIEFNGPMLDMADHTLYLNLLKLAEGREPEDFIFINKAALLKSCGYKKLGKTSYSWLTKAFDRLLQANLKITIHNYQMPESESLEGVTPEEIEKDGVKNKQITIALSLLSTYAYSAIDETYYFALPRASLALFSSQLWGYNDLKKRLLLLDNPKPELSAWLQSYICADDKGEHKPILVETLRRYVSYRSKLADFVPILTVAFNNCLEVDVIKSWTYLNNEHGKLMVKWTR